VRASGLAGSADAVRAVERLQRNSVKKHKTVSVTGRTSIDLVSQSTLYSSPLRLYTTLQNDHKT